MIKKLYYFNLSYYSFSIN